MYKNTVVIFNSFQATNLVDQIKEVDVTSVLSKAAINGLAANFMDDYGIEGHRFALVLAENAMRLDNKEPEWVFITVKTKSKMPRL